MGCGREGGGRNSLGKGVAVGKCRVRVSWLNKDPSVLGVFPVCTATSPAQLLIPLIFTTLGGFHYSFQKGKPAHIEDRVLGGGSRGEARLRNPSARRGGLWTRFLGGSGDLLLVFE